MLLDPIQQASRDQFDRQSRRYGKGHILENISDVDDALRHVPPVPRTPPWALDVATGGGHAGLRLAERGYRVTLSDLSTEMTARATELAGERGLFVETENHPAEALPYGDGAFELVVCRIAAHHFSGPERFAAEAARVLSPGGSLVLIDLSVEDGQPEAEAWLHEIEVLHDASHHRLGTPGVWTRHAEAAGLRVVHRKLDLLKQPDIEKWFDASATPEAARRRSRELVENAPASARSLFRLGHEGEKTVWWWQRLTLVAVKG